MSIINNIAVKIGFCNVKSFFKQVKDINNQPMKNIHVLLDNGHGEETAGKRSPQLPDGRQLREYKWAREVVSLIADMLKREGIECTVLVPETSDVTLGERCRRANAIAKKSDVPTVFLSIHNNAAGNGGWREAYGWSAYTSRGDTKADNLATCLYEAAAEIFPKDKKLRKDYSDGDVDQEADFYVLKHTSMPAVLTENFFMDCRKECEWLLTDEAKEMCARVQVEGVKKYVQTYL